VIERQKVKEGGTKKPLSPQLSLKIAKGDVF